MTKIRLTGWQTGMQKISLTKLLQAEAGLPLPDAKRVVDDILERRSVSVDVSCDRDAGQLVVTMRGLGAICDIEPD